MFFYIGITKKQRFSETSIKALETAAFFNKRKEVGAGRSNLGRFRFLRKKRKTKSILGANIVNLFRNTKFYAIIFEN